VTGAQAGAHTLETAQLSQTHEVFKTGEAWKSHVGPQCLASANGRSYDMEPTLLTEIEPDVCGP
jgi:hypothetical protein